MYAQTDRIAINFTPQFLDGGEYATTSIGQRRNISMAHNVTDSTNRFTTVRASEPIYIIGNTSSESLEKVIKQSKSKSKSKERSSSPHESLKSSQQTRNVMQESLKSALTKHLHHCAESNRSGGSKSPVRTEKTEKTVKIEKSEKTMKTEKTEPQLIDKIFQVKSISDLHESQTERRKLVSVTDQMFDE